jgi:crotonobetainyl-CoA:carnitine CoA-transferase CaiB-like acyl-CoA transferase
VNVSAYGDKGPMAGLGGFDPMGQALSGMLFISGQQEPTVLQFLVLDQLTAITASHAAMTALLARDRHGVGDEVQVSLYGSATWLLYANLFNSSVLGQEIDQSWDRRANSFARTTFKCRDDQWIMGTNHPENRYWDRFCQAIGMPELAADPRFSTIEARTAANVELIDIVDPIFLSRTQAEWLQIMRSAGLLFAPVQRIMDVIDDPQVLSNGYLTDYDHPHLGTIRVPGYPVRFGQFVAGPFAPAPEVGEHTAQILAEIGFSDVEIADQLSKRAINQAGHADVPSNA